MASTNANAIVRGYFERVSWKRSDKYRPREMLVRRVVKLEGNKVKGRLRGARAEPRLIAGDLSGLATLNEDAPQ